MNLTKKEKWLLLCLALTVSFLILIKVFIYDNCFAFDSNDDVNHTFVNLKAAHDIMRQGALPEINLYNNFGTPLIGDALTFPFSIQSITYWFLPDYLAMTLNKAIISFLTIIFLFLFLRVFLKTSTSMFCSLLVFFSPGVLWNFAHHHYQMSLLCFSFILFLQARNSFFKKWRYLLLLYLGYITLFLSVSIQPVCLMIPFFILFLPIKEGFRFNRAINAWGMNMLALISSVIATLPDTIIFFKNISESTRAQWTPYGNIFITIRQQILALLLPPGEWMHFRLNVHFSISTYFSIAFIIFTFIGILLLIPGFRRNDVRCDTEKLERASLLRLILVLGVLPTVGGYILQFYGSGLPFVGSVDSTRIWWFSIIFLVLSIGTLLETSWRKLFTPVALILIGVCTIGILFFCIFQNQIIPEFIGTAFLHRIVILGTLLSLVAILMNSFFKESPTFIKGSGNIGKVIIVTVLMLAQIPTIFRVMGLNMGSCGVGNHYFVSSDEATFQPFGLLQMMEPGYRMATEEILGERSELKAIFGGVLGSGARAIVSDQKLKDIFVNSDLVQDDPNYFFKPPWQAEKLKRLGIRYLLVKQRNGELEAQGWKVLGNGVHMGRRLFLYENPIKPSLVYLWQNEQYHYLYNYELLPNGVQIDLPRLEDTGKLTLAFFYRNSWNTSVDSRKVTPVMNDLGMMEIPVQPGDKRVVFKFQRLQIKLFLFSFLLSLFILLFFYFTMFSAQRLKGKGE